MKKTKKKLILTLALLLAAALAVGITVAWFSDTETVTNKATMGAVDVDLKENVTDPTKTDGDESFSDVTTNTDGDEDDPTNPKYTVDDPEDTSDTPRQSPLIPGTPRDSSSDDGEGADYPASFPGTSYVKQPTVDNLEEASLVRLVVTRSWVDEDGNAVSSASADKIILHLVNEYDSTAGTGDWTHAVEDGKDVFYYNKILAKKGQEGDSTTAPFDYFTVSSSIDNSYAKLTAKIDIKVEAVQAAGLNVTDAASVPADVWAGVSAYVAPTEAPSSEGGSTPGGEGGESLT